MQLKANKWKYKDFQQIKLKELISLVYTKSSDYSLRKLTLELQNGKIT